jgi:hypothetical protein
MLSHASPTPFTLLLHPFSGVKQQRRPLSQLNNCGLVESYSDYKKLLRHSNLKDAQTIRIYLISFAISLAQGRYTGL